MNYRVAKRVFKSPGRKSVGIDTVAERKALDVLREAKECFDGLANFRKERQRLRRYCFGKDNGQWGDLIPDPNRYGRYITEAQHISNQGRVPMQHNMIRKLTKSILGQFQSNQTEPVCVARNRQNQELGEMMSIAIQYVYQLNDVWKLDAANLLEILVSATCFCKVTYGYNSALQLENVMVEKKNPARMFFNPTEDIRGWDTQVIGELHDFRLMDVIASFARNREDALRIEGLYRKCREDGLYNQSRNMSTSRIDEIDFYTPFDSLHCRVIEVWKLEAREMVWCHDVMKGEMFWTELDQVGNIQAINEMRSADAIAAGAEPMLIDYEWRVRRYWYYRYLTPLGDVLQEGETPYWHESHPYAFELYSLFDGDVHSFIGDVVDQQRILNRSLSTFDFIMNTSAKNTLAIAEGTIPDGVHPKDFASEWRKIGGVIIYKPLPGGGGIPQEISSNSRNVGTSEMIQLMMGLINEISGIHEALQGKKAASGVSGRLYEAEANNASTNLVDLLANFQSFRVARDSKIMKVIQQFWSSPVYINIAGKNYSEESKWYNPVKVKGAEMDLSLSENTASSSYRSLMDEYLMELWKSGAISVKNMLANSSLPFADKVLQTIEGEEKVLESEGLGNDSGTVKVLENRL